MDTYGSNSPSQKNGFALSVTIHAILIILVAFLSGHYVKKPPELMTVFLDNGKVLPLRPDKPGGDGRKAGSEGADKRAAKGAPKTVVKRVSRPADDKARNARLPSEADLKSMPVTRTEIGPETVSAPGENSENTVLKGTGEGQGGGGGRGLGTYGSGSGFGGTGRDGMGGGSGRGVGVSRKADVDRYLAEHYSYIRDLIYKHLTYPPMARKMGWMGNVMVSFVISEKGMASGLKIVQSSGHKVLDDNVVETIKDVQPFPKPPAPAPIKIPVKYNLE